KTSRALELFQRRFEETVGSVPELLVHRLDASHDVSQWDTADQPILQGHHVTEAALVYGVDGRGTPSAQITGGGSESPFPRNDNFISTGNHIALLIAVARSGS
ncbi:MAG: hypothetical protein QF538_09670, partial [Acidimicrobiales bacterium]|nr:hypothetical protein [Acidimicrobiales bacterium]